MEELSPKAVREGYAPASFFFAQTSDQGQVRLLVWSPSVATQQDLLKALIRRLPETVHVLLKVARGDEPTDPLEDRDPWQRHAGTVDRFVLLDTIDRCAVFVTQDSRCQLCVRDPATLEYVVLDEVGVVYIYSNDWTYRDLLVSLGFEERMQELVTAGGCWTQTPPEGPEQEAEFIRTLQLVPVPPSPPKRGTVQ